MGFSVGRKLSLSLTIGLALLVGVAGRPGLWLQNGALLTLARATQGQGWLSPAVDVQAADQATAWLTSVVALEPNAPAAWRGLGLAHLLQGESEAALAAWRQTPGLATELASWGEKARRGGDFAAAAMWFGYASALEPTTGRYALEQGLATEAQGEWATAAGVYQAALQQEGLAGVGLSVFYYRLGIVTQSQPTSPDLPAARAAYEQALAADDFDRIEQAADVWYRLGEIDLAGGETAAAQSKFEQALRLSAQHYWALYRLGQLAFEQGNPDQALSYTTQALRWWPEERGRGWPYRLQGAIYHQAGEQERAYAAYAAALVYQPDDAALRDLTDSLRPADAP